MRNDPSAARDKYYLGHCAVCQKELNGRWYKQYWKYPRRVCSKECDKEFQKGILGIASGTLDYMTEKARADFQELASEVAREIERDSA